MGEKYLNAIDKPVPGLITHADSGLHIDHAPRFLQTPLWAASGLPPINLAQAEHVEGDLRRASGGLRLVARKDSSPPGPSPFPNYYQWLLFAGRMFLASPSPAQPQVCKHGGGGRHRRALSRTHRAQQLLHPLPGQEEW